MKSDVNDENNPEIQEELITESEVKSVLDRLQAFIDVKDISNREFGRMIELSSGGASHLFNSKAGFRLKVLLKIKKIFPELNIDWLLENKGDMIKKPINQSTKGNYNQTNIEGDNTQTNYNQVSKPPIEDKKEYTQENPIIEILRKELEEKNKLINGQREEIKDYKEIVKKKDDRIEKLTDKLISV